MSKTKPCPECGDKIDIIATSHDCGWNEDETNTGVEIVDKPILEKRIMDVVNNREQSRCGYPRCFPEDRKKVPAWWIKFLEKPFDTERDELIIVTPKNEKDKKIKKIWRTPYQDRVIDCLKIFYKLRYAEQQELVSMRQSYVFWRGDSMKFMRLRAQIKPQDIKKSEIQRSIMDTVNRLKSNEQPASD